ncbi:MAG: TerC family protein [Terriglobales bacterium]
MLPNWVFWVVFNAFVLLMLVLDLGVFHRKAHVVRFKEAIAWTFVWVSLAGLFALLVHQFGHHLVPHATRPNSELALEFVTGYLIEESLSMDNLFVFLLIFRYFRVDRLHQHAVLYWGILGALVMRAAFILGGVTLINRLHWIIYLFGAFLVYTGIRLFKQQETEIHPENNPVLKLFRRFVPIAPQYEGRKFFVQRGAQWIATPLAVVLIVVETTDLMFATDSIPAILAITRDPFIVYTSNVFAILGLRSLYFALAGMMEVFHYLHYGLSVILIFIGVKMLASEYVHIPIGVALSVVGGILVISVIASLVFPGKKTEA